MWYVGGLFGGFPFPRVSPEGQIERCIPRSGVHLVIIGKLGYWQPSCPVVLAVCDIMPQEGFNFLIGPLGLSVCLRMISRRGVCLNPHGFIKSSDETGGKPPVPITNDFSRESVLPEDSVTEDGQGLIRGEFHFYCLQY